MVSPPKIVILKRVQRCGFCGHEMACPALGFEENPYCSNCLPHRIAHASLRNRHLAWEISGDYAKSIDLRKQKLQ